MQMRRIKARLDEGSAQGPAVSMKQQEAYHLLSRMLTEEREQAAAALAVLDKKKVPAERVKGLLSFVAAHENEIAGATGGLQGAINVDYDLWLASPRGAEGRAAGSANASPEGSPAGSGGLFSPLPAGAAGAEFSSSPPDGGFGGSFGGAPPPPRPQLQPASATSKTVLAKQLSKIELYYKPVVDTSKDVLVLERLPPLEASAAAREAERERERTRPASRIEWGGGKPVNRAVSKINSRRRAPAPHDAAALPPDEYSEADIRARREAAERSKRLLLEIRAIERQLAIAKAGDRAASRSPVLGQGLGGVSARESLASGGGLGGLGGGGFSSRGGLDGGGSVGAGAGAGFGHSMGMRPSLPASSMASGSLAGVGGGGSVSSSARGRGSVLADGGRALMSGGGAVSGGFGGRGGGGGGGDLGLPPATAGGSVVFADGSVVFDFESVNLAQGSIGGGGGMGGAGSSRLGRAGGSRGGGGGRGLGSLASQSAAAPPEPSLGPGPADRDVEFDAVAKKLARLRAAELKQRSELRLLKAYQSTPLSFR